MKFKNSSIPANYMLKYKSNSYCELFLVFLNVLGALVLTVLFLYNYKYSRRPDSLQHHMASNYITCLVHLRFFRRYLQNSFFP